MTTEQLLFTGIASCAGAIVFMFRLEQVRYAETKEHLKSTIDRLSVCEVNRTDLSVRVAVLEKVQELRLKADAFLAAKEVKETAAAAAASLKATAEQTATELKASQPPPRQPSLCGALI